MVSYILDGDKLCLKLNSSNPSAVEGQLIYNSTDKKLRFYNGTAWVDSGAINGYPAPSSFNTVVGNKYNAWSGYSVGNLTTNSYWNVNLGSNSNGVVNIVNTNAFGDGALNYLHINQGYDTVTWPYSGQHIVASAINIPVNKSYWTRIKIYMLSDGRYRGGTAVVYFGNNTDGWTEIYNFWTPETGTGPNSGANIAVTNNQSSFYVIAKGSGVYDVIGGYKLGALSKPNGGYIKFDVYCEKTNWQPQMDMWIDDIYVNP